MHGNTGGYLCQVLIWLFLGSFLPVELRAIEIPGDDRRLLLRVTSERQFGFEPELFAEHRQTAITRGGGVIIVTAVGGPSTPLDASAFRGLGTASELATLGAALAVSRVGRQGTCALAAEGPGFLDITWYGREGRRNSFRVVLDGAPPDPGAPCPVEVLRLVEAIRSFVNAAISHLPQG